MPFAASSKTAQKYNVKPVLYVLFISIDPISNIAAFGHIHILQLDDVLKSDGMQELL